MSALQPPDSHYLLGAQGWLELGDHSEATREFEKLDPKYRDRPEVLEVRWAICAASKDWAGCVDAATRLIELAPESPAGWIHRSYALHELKQTREATDLLLPAAKKFPGNWLVRYNLACYACQMGDHTKAWDWLQDACERGDRRQIRLMALEDADLKALREKVETIGHPKG